MSGDLISLSPTNILVKSNVPQSSPTYLLEAFIPNLVEQCLVHCTSEEGPKSCSLALGNASAGDDKKTPLTKRKN